MSSKSRETKNNRKEDSNFHKKHINHDPRTESAKAVFSIPKGKEG
ncbi:CPC_1213 family protein [Clostridium polynesiense]|nr:CPC_1213 family protein [Clostridium polynesiense]